MLSRVAENIYWMARYMERAENIARFMDVNNHLMLDSPTEQDGGQWMPLVAIMADEERFFKHHPTPTQENVVHYLVCDATNPNSILSCIRMARENARSVREIIPSEMWLQLNTMYLALREVGDRGADSITAEFYYQLRNGSHLFFGLMSDIMTHNEAYQFAQLGRFIERADKSSRLLDVKYFILLEKPSDVGTPFDSIQWMAVLKSVSAYEMYRKKGYQIEPAAVVDFLMHDEEFPRSVNYCLRCARHFLERIVETQARDLPAIGHVEDLRAGLARISGEEFIGRGLHQHIDRLQGGLNRLHGEIHAAFFSTDPRD